VKLAHASRQFANAPNETEKAAILAQARRQPAVSFEEA